MPLPGDYAPSTAKWVRDQVAGYEGSQGSTHNTMQGKPVVILTSLGARTGQLRKAALMRVEHGGEYAVVGSKGGAARHPEWYFNVLAHPMVELQDGADRADYRARLVSGDERDTWWARAVAVFPPYAGYQRKTSREIPVFVLTRVTA